jgi:hypothetical protein
MTSFRKISESQSLRVGDADMAGKQDGLAVEESLNMTIRWTMLVLWIATVMAALSLQARSQSLVSSVDSSPTVGITAPGKLDLTYIRPTQRTEVDNYIFDAFGPHPIVVTGLTAGIDQWTRTPPEWHQGVEGYGRRFASDFGIGVVGTTTRYGLAAAFRQDTLYYRCECRGVLPRLSHAVISTLTARRGEDGHRVFSIPALLAPYAGSTTAIYGWYPSRFGVKDAFRTGNYTLLTYMGGNIGLEFFYSGPHSLLSRLHLNNAHGSPIQGPNR